MTDLELLNQRLQRMERQSRRLQRLLLVAGVLGASLILMGQIRPIPGGIRPRGELETVTQSSRPVEAVEEKIRARQFILVDGENRERASLVADGAGSVFFVLFDKDQKARADISVTPYGPSINFYDPNGKSRTIIGSTSLVNSHVANNGIVERNPPSSIVLFDKDGKVLWRTP